MFIGLYDADFISAPNKHRLNLEIMKLASYYSRTDFVELVMDINDINRFDVVYVRKDIPKSKLNNKILLNDKISWGGMAFTDDIHLPLHPLEIEKQIASTHIYSAYYRDLLKKGKITQKKVEKILESNYLRMYVNGEPVSWNWINPARTTYVYDSYVNYNDNWKENIEDLGSCTRQKLRFFYPFILNEENQADLAYLVESKYIAQKESVVIVLDKPFNFIDFKYFLNDNKTLLNPFLSLEPRVRITIGKDYAGTGYSTEFYQEEIFRVLEIVLYAFSKGYAFGIYFEKDENLNQYEVIYSQMKNWVNYRHNRNTSFIDHLLEKGMSKQAAVLEEMCKRNRFRAVRLFNTPMNKVKGGYWTYERL